MKTDMSTIAHSKDICRRLFLSERTAGRVFYAVNRPYKALLRLPTAKELTTGLITQESTELAYVRTTQAIITLADEQWRPVIVDTPDGRRVPDQWPKSVNALPKCFEYSGQLSAHVHVRATCKRGSPCGYILLRTPLTLVWGRGEEHWPAGNLMACWNQSKMDTFTSISPVSFSAMHEPADKTSALLLDQLRAQQ